MTKAKPEDRKKAALARKREAETWTQAVGLPLDAKLSSIGVVLEHAGLSQCNHFLFRSMNCFSLESLGVDLSLFVLHHKPPMTLLTFPVFDAHSLASWENPLIAVGTTACLEALQTPSPRIVHYVFEVDFLDRRDLTTDRIYRAFRDPRVVVMTRGEDYRLLIEAEFGGKAQGPYLPNCEFRHMVHALLEGTHAE